MKTYRILTVNPGSTSTKIAIFDNDVELFQKTIRHPSEQINKFEKIFDQYAFRKKVIIDVLDQCGVDLSHVKAVVGRGGLLKPISGGTYKVTPNMIKDLKEGVLGGHASNLGGILASEIAANLNVPAYIVDPIVVDEMQDIARISGIPQLPRKSIFHALNQKSAARKAAKSLGKAYGEVNFIVAHMGGGISVGAHKRGKVIDVNNGLDGEGPFSPERAGGLPVGDLVKLCFSGEYTEKQIKKLVRGKGGLVAYLQTNDGQKVQEMIKDGNKQAERIYKALAYQVAKEIGACSAVLKGDVDGIILTGGLAYDTLFVSWIKEHVTFISQIIVYAGENEMVALAEGGLRVLKGDEEAKTYK